ncbi:MAG: polysaccharide biosynthesis/export family protein [Marinilabiliaceae bacterium]|nr:polysaccharide biosynthesis/export family protein [Marinilabiliaceae bacterium]
MKVQKMIGVIVLVSLMLVGCVPLRQSIYLQGNISKELSRINGSFNTDKTDYLVRPNDVLYITVNSLDDRTSAFLNSSSGYTQLPETPMSTSLLGYRVNLDGSIDYPFIGKIYVAGLTLPEIRDKVGLAVNKYLEQSSVIVKLLNDNITVVGEVNSPGRFLLAGEELNLVEALSLAGDVNDFANRKRVRLIRKEGDVQQMIVINMLDEKVMFSPYFYMKPGDILYVEPRRLKSWSLSSISLGFGLTVVNSVIMIFTLVTVLQD